MHVFKKNFKCTKSQLNSLTGSEQPSMKHRSKLDYTEACLFETLRLGSVVGLGVPHMTICDSQVGKELLLSLKYL